MSSEYQLVEKGTNEWDKYYDHNTGCYFWWNNITQESVWTSPKQVIPNKPMEAYLPIDEFLGQEANGFNGGNVHYDDDIKPRCIRCQNNENVGDHKFCDACVSLIYNHNKPLLEQFKIECKGCRGWGLDLVQKNGYCKRCTKAVGEFKQIDNHHISTNIMPTINEPVKKTIIFPPCIKCGGWGKDLIIRDSLCNHCILKLVQEDFEKKVFKKCYVCQGWGLDLVKDDGMCKHCYRLSALNRNYLEKRKYGQLGGY